MVIDYGQPLVWTQEDVECLDPVGRTGTIAGVIKASSIKDVLLDALSHTNMGELLLAPVSGVLMSAATASTTAGATVASSSFADIIIAAGISGVWGAAMINSGATVLDHLPAWIVLPRYWWGSGYKHS